MKPDFANVYDAILNLGHDEEYEPRRIPPPTQHGPGSPGKIEELRRRVLAGEQLWNNFDEPICDRVAAEGKHTVGYAPPRCRVSFSGRKPIGADS